MPGHAILAIVRRRAPSAWASVIAGLAIFGAPGFAHAQTARAEPGTSEVGAVEVAFLGALELSPATQDRSGLSELMGDLPPDLLGSFGSGLAYSGRDDLYFAVSDRGPLDGAYPFPTRLHTLRITAHPGEDPPLRFQVVDTSLLRDASGVRFLGLSGALDPGPASLPARLDPEGVAPSPRGTLWTCDEYGPWIDEWSSDGRHIRRIEPPARFLATTPGPDKASEMPPNNAAGRQPNRGFEGLAASPDGRRLVAILQGSLLQDGALDERNKRVGVNIRMLDIALDDAGAPQRTREFVYVLDHPSHGVNEIASTGKADRFLVIERDGRAGMKSQARRIYEVDLGGATDVSDIESLPTAGLPSGVRPVNKRLLFDMLDPRFGMDRERMPEKVEGLAVGPELSDGRRLLLLASDNDYDDAEPSWIWAFALREGPQEAPNALPAGAP